MKPALLLIVSAALLLCYPPNTVTAKSARIGIYAIIDQVAFEPASAAPDFVRISGIFVVPVRLSSGAYRSPERGYLYFRVARGAEQGTRRDWNQLKAVAGSGEVVAFGQYWVPNPDDPQGNPHHSLEVTVHQGSAVATPEEYPLPLEGGILKASEIVSGPDFDPNAPKIVGQLLEASHR